FSSATIRSFGHYRGHKSDAYSFQAVVADVAVDPGNRQGSIIHLFFFFYLPPVLKTPPPQSQLGGAPNQQEGYALCEDMEIDEAAAPVVVEIRIFGIHA